MIPGEMLFNASALTVIVIVGGLIGYIIWLMTSEQ